MDQLIVQEVIRTLAIVEGTNLDFFPNLICSISWTGWVAGYAVFRVPG
jgi:hypothetical protein